MKTTFWATFGKLSNFMNNLATFESGHTDICPPLTLLESFLQRHLTLDIASFVFPR